MSSHPIHRWLENHLRAFLFGLGELLRAPAASGITLFVIGIAMAFPTGLYALLQNAQQLAQQWHNSPSISVYLQPHIPDEQVNALIKQLQQRHDIAEVSYISPAQGLQIFQQQPELHSALKALPENPLPGIIVITPRIGLPSPANIDNLISSLKKLPNIDVNQLDSLWITRFYELMTLGNRITYGLMLLFGIGVALIVANTMRLTTQSHRQEIIVLKLIGATPAFIRRPMLYRGALYGLIGGLIAWLLVIILFWWLKAPAERLATSYNGHWGLHNISHHAGMAMIIACALLGLAGAWLSVERYLHTPEEI